MNGTVLNEIGNRQFFVVRVWKRWRRGRKSKFRQKLMSSVWDVLTAINGLRSQRRWLRARAWRGGGGALERVGPYFFWKKEGERFRTASTGNEKVLS